MKQQSSRGYEHHQPNPRRASTRRLVLYAVLAVIVVVSACAATPLSKWQSSPASDEREPAVIEASGVIGAEESVHRLLDESELRGILHLLADHNAGGGTYESEFVRGAVWMAPVRSVAAGGTLPRQEQGGAA